MTTLFYPSKKTTLLRWNNCFFDKEKQRFRLFYIKTITSPISVKPIVTELAKRRNLKIALAFRQSLAITVSLLPQSPNLILNSGQNDF